MRPWCECAQRQCVKSSEAAGGRGFVPTAAMASANGSPSGLPERDDGHLVVEVAVERLSNALFALRSVRWLVVSRRDDRSEERFGRELLSEAAASLVDDVGLNELHVTPL